MKFFFFLIFPPSKSESLSSDSSGELDILGHNGDSSGVDGAQVGILEQSNQVSLSSLLEGQDGGRLESELSLVLSGNISDHSLEWELSDQQLSGLLVLSDFSEGDGSWSESVWLLDTSSDSWGGFSGSLGGELLSWGLSSGRLSSGLLSSCHFYLFIEALIIFLMRNFFFLFGKKFFYNPEYFFFFF